MYRMALNKHLSRTMSAYLIHSSDADFPVSHPTWTFGPVISQSPGMLAPPHGGVRRARGSISVLQQLSARTP